MDAMGSDGAALLGHAANLGFSVRAGAVVAAAVGPVNVGGVDRDQVSVGRLGANSRTVAGFGHGVHGSSRRRAVAFYQYSVVSSTARSRDHSWDLRAIRGAAGARGAEDAEVALVGDSGGVADPPAAAPKLEAAPPARVRRVAKLRGAREQGRGGRRCAGSLARMHRGWRGERSRASGAGARGGGVEHAVRDMTASAPRRAGVSVLHRGSLSR